jgi:hypothetical protein
MSRFMFSSNLKAAVLVACLGSLMLPLSCGQKAEQDTRRDSRSAADTTARQPDSLIIELTGVDSVSVFDLLRAHHEVDYRSSAMGVMVTAIDSVSNGSGYFWMYSVNDSMATVACDRYITSAGDAVRWYYRKAGR